ncbi:MAG: TolC family protein [Bryobacteraceae bacterium]
MSHHQKIAIFFFLVTLVSGFAQTPEISITAPKAPPVVGPILRPFQLERRIVSPVNLANSPRLETLVRAGKLYLSVPDVIALTLENNVDIAIQRYGPFLAREVLRRAQGGGPLRDFGVAINPGPVSVSLAGVSSSTVGLGVSGAGVGSGGGIVVQYGVTPPNLDPSIFGYANFSHSTTPLSNTILDATPSLINDSRLYEFGYSQQFTSGTSAQMTYYTYHSTINSPANVLNPYTQGYLDLYVTQNLLQGFGVSINNRNIRVARNNMKVTDLQLKRQVITTVSAVLNLYWDLVDFDEDMRIKQRAVDTARQLYNDNQQQVKLGTLAPVEVTRAAAEVSSREEDLLIAQTNVSQQETVLKNALSRDGVASAWLDEVEIVPLDRFAIPEKEELKPTPELIKQALTTRPEIEQTIINLESSKINIGGTRNALLPALQAFVELTNNGLTGEPNILGSGEAGAPLPVFVGGYGNALGQIFRRDYPNYSAGFSINIPFRNRQAQADYVADELSLRQSELQLRRTLAEVRVEVKNAIVGLQQARARFETAAATRKLAEQTLNAEQQRFKFGESTTTALVVQAERDLASDQSAEVQSMANFTHAQIAFDEAVGQTLDANGISMEEATSGRVKRQSILPAALPEAVKGVQPQ